MSEPHLLIEGIRGLFAGERYVLAPGQIAVIGRSRSCDISLKHTRGYLADKRDKPARDRSLRRMSRRHLEIEYCTEGALFIRNLSPNGFTVHSRRQHEEWVVKVASLQDEPVTLTFGDEESLVLSLANAVGHGIPPTTGED